MKIYRDLVKDYGSPLYVYQLAELEAAMSSLRQALPGTASILYSLKANPHPEIVARLARSGCQAEISSPGELDAAISAGFSPSTACLYTGPAKTDSEITYALSRGVSTFSAESLTDLRRIGDIAAGADLSCRCLIRVSTERSVRGAVNMNTGSTGRFGVQEGQLLSDLRKYLEVPGVQIIGTHFFPVSNAERDEDLVAAFNSNLSAAARLRTAGLPTSVVDLGGGFPALTGTAGPRRDLSSIAARLRASLDSFLPGWESRKPAILFESGRYLTNHCGALVGTVIDVKQRSGRNFVILDTGINHLGGMAALGRTLRARMQPHLIPGDMAERNGVSVSLAGPLCTPADLHGIDIEMSNAVPGDLVVFPNVGAYGLTASLMGFLSRPLPIEVTLDGDDLISVTRLLVHRVSIAHECIRA